jgi:hypothetical protein
MRRRASGYNHIIAFPAIRDSNVSDSEVDAIESTALP